MKYIKEIVDGLIELYGTRDVYDLLDALDVILIRKKFISNIKGKFLRNHYGDEFIFVSNDLTDKEERIIIAHELGHLILHTNLITSHYTENNLLVKNKFEIEASKFASELLIHDDIKIEEGTTIKELSCYLEVPEEFIKFKYQKENKYVIY